MPHYTDNREARSTARPMTGAPQPAAQTSHWQPLPWAERQIAAAVMPPPAADDVLGIVDDTLPLPKGHGRFLVAGTEDVEVFVTLGRAGFKALIVTLLRAGVNLSSLGRIPDFGCGVGRVLRYWHSVPDIAIPAPI